MCYCPTPTLYLNLALTGDCAFQLSPKKPHSVWFISVLKSGDMGQCPEKSPSPCNTCVIIQIYVLICHKNAHTHTHTHTQHNWVHLLWNFTNSAITLYLEETLWFFRDIMFQQVCLINYQRSMSKLFRNFLIKVIMTCCKNEYTFLKVTK